MAESEPLPIVVAADPTSLTVEVEQPPSTAVQVAESSPAPAVVVTGSDGSIVAVEVDTPAETIVVEPDAPVFVQVIDQNDPESIFAVSSDGVQFLRSFEHVALEDGETEITLPHVPLYGYALYINGLAQRQSAYTVVGALVTIPADMHVIQGDVLTIDYIL